MFLPNSPQNNYSLPLSNKLNKVRRLLGLCPHCVSLAELCLTLQSVELSELSQHHGTMTGPLQKAGLCNNNKARALLLFGCWDSRDRVWIVSVTAYCKAKWNVLCHLYPQFA